MRFDGGTFKPSTLHSAAFDWIAVDHRPRMVVRTDGSILWTNLSAQRLLAECSGINAVDQVIHLSNPEHDAQFHAFLRNVTANPHTMALKFDGESSFCVFRGHWVESVGGCCIEVRFSSNNRSPHLIDFDHVFGLTRSEAQTATALYGGQSAREIADKLRISIDTVRSHIRQLYSKIGVSGREQLFRQLDAFRLD